MTIFMIVESKGCELPRDMDLNLRRLAERWGIPYQTAKNAVSTGNSIRYINSKIIKVKVPKEELMYRITK